MSTLKDVAQRAGVSSITVSRVINTPELVKEKTKDKVMLAMAELKYGGKRKFRMSSTHRLVH